MVGLQGRCHSTYLRLKELMEEGYVGEVVSVQLTQTGSGILSRGSDRTWQADRTLGANTLTINFGHVIDALCMCLGEFTDVSALVTTRVPQWHETDTDKMVDVTSPDNVMVTGTLANRAVVSAYASSVPWLGSGYRLEVYGRDGTLVLTAEENPQNTRHEIVRRPGSNPELGEMPIPDRLTWVPESVPAGLSSTWHRCGHALRTRFGPANGLSRTSIRRWRDIGCWTQYSGLRIRASDRGFSGIGCPDIFLIEGQRAERRRWMFMFW